MVTKSELLKCFVSGWEKNEDLKPANVVDGLYAIARSLKGVSRALHDLGLANASTPQGAIEVLSGGINDGFAALADAVGELSRSVNGLPEEVKDGFESLSSKVGEISKSAEES